MADTGSPRTAASPSMADLPERLCTWCKVPMRKRLVASGQFVHYTCPKCVFQHTTRLGEKPGPAGQTGH